MQQITYGVVFKIGIRELYENYRFLDTDIKKQKKNGINPILGFSSKICCILGNPQNMPLSSGCLYPDSGKVFFLGVLPGYLTRKPGSKNQVRDL